MDSNILVLAVFCYLLIGIISLLLPPFERVIWREDTYTELLVAQGKVSKLKSIAFNFTVVVLVSLIWPLLLIAYWWSAIRRD